MDRQKEQQKREKFKGLLRELAQDDGQRLVATDERRRTYYRKFEQLYGRPDTEDEFRHFYSDIFLVLTDPQEEPTAGSRDVLAENLRALWENYQPDDGGPDVSAKLRKLYDHLSLDLARLNYNEAVTKQTAQHEADLAELQGTVKTVRQEQRNLRSLNEDTRNSLKAAQGKINNAQKEYIAILGIFSAVILTFTGGIAFTTSVLENLHQSSFYRLVLVVALIGLVLCNVFYLLFLCIQNLMDRPVRKSQVLVIVLINVLLMALIATTVWSWYDGAIETRDLRIGERQAEQSSRLPLKPQETVMAQGEE